MKILLVEDNLADARLIQEMLREAPPDAYAFRHADRLEVAREFISNSSPDVILLDLGLPDSQGLATLVLARESCPATPIVVLTGLDDHEFAMEAVRAGAEDYLPKGANHGRTAHPHHRLRH